MLDKTRPRLDNRNAFGEGSPGPAGHLSYVQPFGALCAGSPGQGWGFKPQSMPIGVSIDEEDEFNTLAVLEGRLPPTASELMLGREYHVAA